MLRLCAAPGCVEPAGTRGRCAKHNRDRNADISRAGTRTYHRKRWAATRNAYLAQHPLCECDDDACTRIATDVHHRTPLADGGDPWDFNNLQALTHECHSRLTWRETLDKPPGRQREGARLDQAARGAPR
jgi:5-methylcytosine-specific restriction protein A